MKYIKLFENYNEKFYLVIDDVSRLLNSESFLEKGTLKGLKGISENEDILNVLGTFCDIFIEMDKNKVLEKNNLTKVIYDDINFLCDNNFKNFKRIKSYGLNLYNDYRFFTNYFSLISMEESYMFDLKKENIELYEFLTSKHFHNIIFTEKPELKNFDELLNYILHFLKMDENILRNDLSQLFISDAYKYRYEEEWINNIDEFIIPNNSIIEVYPDYIIDNIGEENLEECISFFEKVKHRYIIKIMN